MEEIEKAFFVASKTITDEKMKAKRGLVTESMALTAAYLRRLHSAPSANVLDPYVKRYRG